MLRRLKCRYQNKETGAREVQMLTGFEKVYWNGHCVDAAHAASDATNIASV